LSKYSTGFRNRVIKQILPPENKSISTVCKEIGVSDQTIRNWLKLVKNDKLKKYFIPLNKASLQQVFLVHFVFCKYKFPIIAIIFPHYSVGNFG
jgi:hypothetical protein